MRALPIALVGLTAFAGCEEGFDVPIVWEGQHVRIGTDADIDDWCPGTLARTDSYVGALKSIQDVRPDLVVDFFVLDRPLDTYSISCATDDLGCAAGGVAYSRVMPHEHELVHAVRDAAGGSPRAIEEGAASYWGGILAEDTTGASGEHVPVDEALVAEELTIADYERLAHFTSYLVDAFGPGPNAALLDATSQRTSRTALQEAFEAAFGTGLPETIDAYESSLPWCSREATRSPFFDCSFPSIPLCTGAVDPFPLSELEFESTSWIDHAFELEMSCSDENVIGPRLGWMWRDLVIEVPAGVHSVAGLTGMDRDPSEVLITVKRCGTDCTRAEPQEIVVSLSGAVTDQLELEGGTHVVRVAVPEDEPGPVALGWGCAE